MTTWGIPGWTPHWLDTTPALVAEHGQRLRDLAGQQLMRSWVVWDLTHDQRFADLPVVLQIGDSQLEVCLQKFEEVSLTWNTIETDAGIEPWPYDGWELEWRLNADPTLASACGHTIEAVSLQEHLFQTHTLTGQPINETWLLAGLVFQLSSGRVLQLYNALDEVGISDTGPTADASTRLQPLLDARSPE